MITAFVLPLSLTVLLVGCAEESETKSVATVNGESITQEELKETLMDQYGAEALDTLVTNKVIELEAEKGKITVSEEELQKELDELIESYGGEETFQELLTSNSMSEEDVKEDIRTFSLTTKLMESVIDITDIEVATYFEENKETYNQVEQVEASHILVADEETVKEVQAKLEAGGDFAELATEYSTDTASNSQGGSLGYFGEGEMVEEFETAAFAMKIDEVSDPIQTEYGYHIIKVTGKKEAKEAVLGDVKEEVYDNLLDTRINEQYSTWLTEKLTEYDIVTNL